MSEKKCPKCSAEMKESVEKIKKMKLFSSQPDSRGGYFGERPEEYGQGGVEWAPVEVEVPVYKCYQCGFTEEK